MVVAREITKRFEETIHGTAVELAARLKESPVKGEIVVIISPPETQEAPSEDELIQRLHDAFSLHRTRDAAKLVADETGVAKNILYDLALKLKNNT